jgi:hypothetical protein
VYNLHESRPITTLEIINLYILGTIGEVDAARLRPWPPLHRGFMGFKQYYSRIETGRTAIIRIHG